MSQRRIPPPTSVHHPVGAAARGVDTAVFTVARQLADNALQGGPQALGLREGGVDLLDPGGSITDEIMKTVDACKAAIIDGSLAVPAGEEQLAAFTPVAPDAMGSR